MRQDNRLLEDYYINLLKKLKLEASEVNVDWGNVSLASADSLSCKGEQCIGTGTPDVDEPDVDISVVDGNIQPDIWYDSLSEDELWTRKLYFFFSNPNSKPYSKTKSGLEFHHFLQILNFEFEIEN